MAFSQLRYLDDGQRAILLYYYTIILLYYQRSWQAGKVAFSKAFLSEEIHLHVSEVSSPEDEVQCVDSRKC